jgi:hypothetical protein
MTSQDVYAQLPARQARGSIENRIRRYMYPLLLKGVSREEAERRAIAKVKEEGYPVDNLKLEYRSE